ncbi:sister chromatid cohesion protein Dcc1 [Abortiporus biennis]|nr:sister chromatid cohesion protein Dcc1 [Abortiporus biennis]
MTDFNLKFTSSPSENTGTYKLLELPPELLKEIESQGEQIPSSWSIKGQTTEDAVLCTANKTYALRSVVLSNSVLVVTPPMNNSEGNPDTDVVIRDELHEILELVPCVPKLQGLRGMLRGRVYDEGHEDEDEDMDEDVEGNENENSQEQAKKRKFTYADAREMLQSSDGELSEGLKQRRILILPGGELRPISHSLLTTILELLLNFVVQFSFPHDAASVADLTTAIEEGQDIRRQVTTQVMEWFGDISKEGGKWKMDVEGIVKEVGIGILRSYKDDPIPEDEFLTKWRTAVGDSFESVASLPLLSGNYLSFPSPISFPPIPVLAYFPASELPSDPAARFNDLFLTRPRWKADEISPFLLDICVNNKERDKLLLKFARAITDSEGIWYTARAKYNG